MSRPDPDVLLAQAARLQTLMAVVRARSRGARATTSIREPKLEIALQPETYPEPAPDEHARTIAAELLHRVALDESGAAYDDNDPATWGEADAAIPEIVSLGQVKCKIVDADASNLAVTVGAIEPGDIALCLRVEFDTKEGAPVPAIGQVIAVPTEEPGVTLAFGIWLTGDDLHDPAAPKLGPDAQRNPALDVLKPRQALLVQVLDAEDAP